MGVRGSQRRQELEIPLGQRGGDLLASGDESGGLWMWQGPHLARMLQDRWEHHSRPVRHGWQRLGVDRGLLARQLQRVALRRQGLDAELQ